MWARYEGKGCGVHEEAGAADGSGWGGELPHLGEAHHPAAL